MKKTFSIFAIAFVSLFATGLVACNNGNTGNAITVNPASLSFGANDAAPKTVTVSGTDWTITGDAWIHATPQSGTGMVSISVTVDANTGASRTGTITVSGADAASKTVSITQSAAGIMVSSISLSETTLTLEVDGTAQLTATVLPSDANQNVTWSSSNTAVATVDGSGLVTAVGTGEADITATAADGSEVVSAPCAITVNPAIERTPLVYQTGNYQGDPDANGSGKFLLNLATYDLSQGFVPSGPGYNISFPVYSLATIDFAPGTYIFETSNPTFAQFTVDLTDFIDVSVYAYGEGGASLPDLKITGGAMEVTKEGDIYTVILDLILTPYAGGEDVEFHGIYNGEFYFFNFVF